MLANLVRAACTLHRGRPTATPLYRNTRGNRGVPPLTFSSLTETVSTVSVTSGDKKQEMGRTNVHVNTNVKNTGLHTSHHAQRVAPRCHLSLNHCKWTTFSPSQLFRALRLSQSEDAECTFPRLQAVLMAAGAALPGWLLIARRWF